VRNALTPGYYLSRLRREIRKFFRQSVNKSRVQPSLYMEAKNKRASTDFADYAEEKNPFTTFFLS
jgi:hypothetical protein